MYFFAHFTNLQYKNWAYRNAASLILQIILLTWKVLLKLFHVQQIAFKV